VRYTLLTAVGLVLISPFVLSFLGTFKSQSEITAFPPTILPKQWLFSNWSDAWNVKIATRGSVWPAWLTPLIPATLEDKIFPKWLFNSLWLAIINAATQLFFCALAGYAFARMNFPGKNIIFSFLIASMAIPGAITLIPGFVFYSRLGWVDTYWPLLIPAIAPAFGIFVLTQFFKSIPKELEEAAFMDGSTRFRTFWQIALPLARPALVSLGVLQFQGSWNNFQGPLLFLRSAENMTLTLGVAFFRSQRRTEWSSILIGAMFNAIPVLILFFIFNRYYVEGASYSGFGGS
jgi:multiple sugar transport system permease protein